MYTVEVCITVENAIEAEIVEKEFEQIIANEIGGICTRLSYRPATEEEISLAEKWAIKWMV